MSDDQSFEWLRGQLSLLLKRIERLEGKQEELGRQIIPPGMLYPKRSEFELLADRVARIEQPPQPKKR